MLLQYTQRDTNVLLLPLSHAVTTCSSGLIRLNGRILSLELVASKGSHSRTPLRRRSQASG